MTTPLLSHYVAGRDLSSSATQSTSVHNPSTGEVLGLTPHGSAEEVDQAVQAAKTAFPSWRDTPVSKRATFLFRYKELLEQRFEELARLVTRENGKTLPESRGDLRRGIEVVEFACGIVHLIKGETVPQISAGMDGATTLEPLGVCAGITPFNFPAMVPMWMYPVAIACGNTFVLKPSEKVPLTALKLAELATEAGLPAGVLNVVLGAREVVDALCSHPDIAALSFVGSSAVAKHVYTTGTAHGKRVQAAGGAKNVMLVMPDAEPESTLRAVLGASFGCAGQRCMAGSVVLGLGDQGDSFFQGLRAAVSSLKVLPTDSHEDSEMGPVIDGHARDRLFEVLEKAPAAGIQISAQSAKIPEKGFFVPPTLLENVTAQSSLAREELFGPVLASGKVQSLEEAVEWINGGGYGNGAVIYTREGGAAREFARRVHCGMVGVNVGVPAPMSVFSFSGWNQSFFGDLHVQGMEGIRFYTRQKVVFSRWDDHYFRTQGW